jgi:hypothetical protein
MDLTVLITDYNGAIFAEAGVVEWGYIPEAWKLAQPEGEAFWSSAQIPDAQTAGIAMAGLNGAHAQTFMKANFKRVRPLVDTADEALWVTLMRYHAATRGLICKQAGRKVREDEYSTERVLDGNWAHANNNIPPNLRSVEIARWVKRFGNAVLHAVALAFSSRGHHYKADYKEYYERLMAVQGVDMKPTFTLPSYEVMFRLSIHCIGVWPLVALAISDRQANIMSAPMAIRWTPHAPVAGCAHITTLKAALTEMNKEAWFGAFQAKFQAQIADIDTAVQAVAAHPYEYHVATSFITGQPRRFVTPQAKNAFDKLSQFALGYIDFLGRKHSLAGEKAVTSHSGGMGSVANQFSKACQKYSAGDFTAATMREWLQSV